MSNPIANFKFLLISLLTWCSTSLSSAQELQKYDQSQTELIPIKVTINTGTIELIAGGQKINFKGSLVSLDADTKLTPEWSVSEGEFTTFSLTVTAKSATVLQRVKWFAGKWEKGVEQVVQSTALMDNVIFLHKNGISFFLSLDFPYSKIDSNGINYPPYRHLESGEQYVAHSLTVGACKLSGHKVGKFDRAEIEAISSYVDKRFKPRFDRPIVLSSGITNRMTDVRDGRIFYSMFDNPTIALSPYLVEEDLVLNADVGIEYYQAFEGVFDWPDEKNTGAKLNRLQKRAHELGIRMGDYAVPQGLYCPHYNYSHRALNRPDWLIVDKNGQPSGPECLASPEYSELLRERLIEHNRKYGLQLICLDFLNIKPCYADNHGHEAGDVYQQIRSLVEIMKELNGLDPNFLIWSNSGNWIDLMPKLTWYNQNVYLTDPHVREYSSHLNVLKMLGDGRREQMVSVHESHFVPYRCFTNYEYYLAPQSRLSDTKVFEYSFLQGLAVTPNIGLGEFRSFLERIPAKDAERCKEFVRHWLQFIRDNYEVWKHTRRIGDPPGVGAAEVYGHIKNDNGFLCFVNQNPFPTTTTLVMDSSIGLNEGDSFLLSEVYRLRGPIAEQSLPYAKRGDTLIFKMAAHTVRIIEVASKMEMQLPMVYGLPADIEPIENGYKVILRMPQGKRIEIGLALPLHETVRSVTAKQTPTVPMYTFPVSATMLSQRGNLARIEITAPRELAPRELTHWHISPGDIEVDLPSADHSGFLGALVHNAFTEDYEVQLNVLVQPTDVTDEKLPSDATLPAMPMMVPATGQVTYSTQFILPFIEGYGHNRGVEDDAIVELAFADPDQVQKVEVLLNDKQVPVLKYRNPKQPAYESFYIALNGAVGAGEVTLKMNVTYK